MRHLIRQCAFLALSLMVLGFIKQCSLFRASNLQQQASASISRQQILARSIQRSAAAMAFINPRQVVKRIVAHEQPEGDGAVVRRSIGRPELRQLDPFLMLDYFTVSPPAGFPDHPHRGFETVTYMLEGAFTHQDFAGHTGTIQAGDLQWMTAGRGIVHCEMPASTGVQRGLQLWINLSSKFKMIEPNYQELESGNIPVAEKDGTSVKVIAGESLGISSPVYTRTPTMYLDVTMQPGASFAQEISEGWNSFAYTLEGRPTFGSKGTPPIEAHTTVELSHGDGVMVWNDSDKACRFVLIAGQPLNEPVFQHGPFVMNTREEIVEAIRDYKGFRNGFERAAHWQSHPLDF
ncbi:pirin-like protein isoform X1 [Selaginella moellendorffii]|nr:pirin-like protein isoform X1 [Selaginella moellendorffii]|eukprot:XP_002992823.2 pirin-like protein isoform X1 [Selaginella moellendorffii]